MREDDEARLRDLMQKPDAAAAVQKLAIAFEHYNEKHPQTGLDNGRSRPAVSEVEMAR